MDLGDAALILAAGVGAGTINAVAGGGTLISFPLLVWAGRDPVVANATNALALWPGALAGAVGFRREIAGATRLLPALIPAALLGGAAGGFLLLQTPSRLFASFVPFLVLFATLMVAAQRPLLAVLRGREPRPEPAGGGRTAALFVGQLAVSIYGGYFGAAMGILMLAALGLYGLPDIHQRNGLKNVLGAVTNGVAGLYFAAAGAVDWADAGVLAVGAVVGGYGGAALGRRMSRRAAELLVLVIGLGATAALLARGRG